MWKTSYFKNNNMYKAIMVLNIWLIINQNIFVIDYQLINLFYNKSYTFSGFLHMPFFINILKL
jgi:hypothetical protein